MKWEYKAIVIQVLSGDPLTKTLNPYGEQGWELVQCDLSECIFIFKRPVKNSLGKAYTNALTADVRKQIDEFGGKIG